MARCFRARWPSEWLPGSSWHSCRLLRVVSSAIPNAPERRVNPPHPVAPRRSGGRRATARSEEHTSELQSQSNLVCRLLLEKKKKKTSTRQTLLTNNTRDHR